MLELKEAEYEGLVTDSECLKDELKTCLQVQDELIKRYRDEKQGFTKSMKALKKERDDLQEENEVSKRKLKAYDEEIQSLLFCILLRLGGLRARTRMSTRSN